MEGVIIFQKYFGFKLSTLIQAVWAQRKNKIEFLFMLQWHLYVSLMVLEIIYLTLFMWGGNVTPDINPKSG